MINVGSCCVPAVLPEPVCELLDIIEVSRITGRRSVTRRVTARETEKQRNREIHCSAAPSMIPGIRCRVAQSLQGGNDCLHSTSRAPRSSQSATAREVSPAATTRGDKDAVRTESFTRASQFLTRPRVLKMVRARACSRVCCAGEDIIYVERL